MPGKMSKGKPEKRFMDAVTKNMKVAGVKGEDARDSVRWRKMVHCGDH